MPGLHRVDRCALLAAALAIAGVCWSDSGAPAGGQARQNTRYPQHILLIRHAEKTGDKDDVHLSQQGKERAAVLDRLFVASRDRPDPFPTPDFLFAARHHKDSQRPVETLSPLAQKFKLAINDRYDNKLPGLRTNGDKEKPAKPGMAELRAEIFGSPKYFGKTILVAWRHSTISQLAKALHASKVPPLWEDRVFDRVWQLSYDDQGNTTFRDRPQRLLPGDAEK
jgi:hypothetical protein